MYFIHNTSSLLLLHGHSLPLLQYGVLPNGCHPSWTNPACVSFFFPLFLYTIFFQAERAPKNKEDLIPLIWYHLILVPWNIIQKQNENTCITVTQIVCAGKAVLDLMIKEKKCYVNWIDAQRKIFSQLHI